MAPSATEVIIGLFVFSALAIAAVAFVYRVLAGAAHQMVRDYNRVLDRKVHPMTDEDDAYFY